MRTVLFSLFCSALCCAAAPTRIFDFSTGEIAVNETLPVVQRGIETGSIVDGIDGLPVTFKEFRRGNASWPYVATKPGALGVADWRKYPILRCGVRNVGSHDCILRITVRDAKSARHTVAIPVKARFNGFLNLKTAALAGKIDLAQVRSLDFALSKPEQEVKLLLTTLELDDSAATAPRSTVDPGRIVPRVFDLRKASAQTTGKTELKRNADGSIDVTTSRYRKGDRGCQVIFNAASPEYGIATHIAYEFELLSPYGNYCGLTIADANGKSMWQGTGTPGKDTPARGSQQLFDTGLELDNLKNITLIETGPTANDQTTRLKKLQLEFRPEVIRDQIQSRLAILKRQTLDGAERKRADALQTRLDAAYARVSGATLRYGDADAFLKTARSLKDEVRRELRSFNNRAAFAATGLNYGVAHADSMTSVFLTGPGSELKTGKAALELAVNEYESFQPVVIAGAKQLKNVKVELGSFSGPGGDALKSECAVIGHSETTPMLYPREHTGFYPETILSYQQNADILPGESVPFWVRIFAPKGTTPGRYTAQVTVSGDGLRPYRFPLEVEVFGFMVPDGTVLPTSYSFNEKDYERLYKFGKDQAARDAFITQMVDLAAKYKITYDQMYWWGMKSMKRDTFFANLKRLNDAGLLQRFCLMYLYQPGKGYTSDKWLTDPDDPLVNMVIARNLDFLKTNVPKLKELGLFDKAYIYAFDEAQPNQVTAKLCASIRKAYPEIPLMSSMRYGDPTLPAAKEIDIWVPIAPRFAMRPELTEKFRKNGKQVWWYLCDFPRPPEPSFMLEVPAAVPRIFMGMMTEKYRPDGFLYWAANCWHLNKEPIGQGPRTAWNPVTVINSDTAEGNLFYPGANRTVLPSIRLENYRDGVEDHWYYTLLDRALKSGKGTPDARKAAAAVLPVPESIVRTTADYSTDPELIREQRRKVARAIELLK